MRADQIAIIGIGCRFPGQIGTPAAYWQALAGGLDAITEIPASRFDVARWYDPRPGTPGHIMTRWGGFLGDIDAFDAYFFGISPREAARLDPQQRLLLEVAWEALEDAGQLPRTPALRDSGVFVGVWLNDYEARLFHDPARADFYMTTGSGRYAAAGRLSYAFDFQGPSLTVDTACSSSLVAVHLACQSLHRGECRLALAGGANVILQPQITIAYSQAKMMAPDGRCKFGDARGDGYVRSEGCGVVVLKRLADALADGDPIYAVIAGSAVNNDGRSSGFLATPGTAGQEDLLRKAYRAAGISPGETQYVEAHGTGTRAGDPVELQALGQVLAEGRPEGSICYVGSVKTNLGHTEGAAGIAGLIKVALSLKHQLLPPNLHFETPNPAIPWTELPLRVPTELLPWPAHVGPALAGVSAFGIAGTNAHVVLAEAPAAAPLASSPTLPPAAVQTAAADSAAGACLLPLSAHTPAALAELVTSYQALLAPAGRSESTAAAVPSLHDLCYTASVRRSHHAHRAAFVAGTPGDLAQELAAFTPAVPAGSQYAAETSARKVAFVFSGQGSQWVGMGRRLLQTEAVFRAQLEACDRALGRFVPWSLLAELSAPEEHSRLAAIDVIQPALFAIQVSLAALWRAWGIEPQAVIGHSLGEVAAAHVAGALSLEDAARVICTRSSLMREVSGQGAMAVVDLPLAAAEQLAAMHPGLCVAVSNSPRSTVLAGAPDVLQAAAAHLQAEDVFCRFVKVDVAAHSPHMEPLRPRLEEALATIAPTVTAPTAPAMPVVFYSTVTGGPLAGEQLDATYWGQNLRRPVLFAAAVAAAVSDGCDTFIEVGPHPVLVPALEQCFAARETGAASHSASVALAAIPSCNRSDDEQVAMLRALGRLYGLGYEVPWSRLFGEGGRCVSLPSYPWQREHFWLGDIEGFADGDGTLAPSSRRTHPLLGWEISLAGDDSGRVWENVLAPTDIPLLFEHRVGATLLLPAAAYLALALAAGEAVLGAGDLELTDVRFHRPLVLQEGANCVLQTHIRPAGEQHLLQIYSRTADGAWLLHVTAAVRRRLQAARTSVMLPDRFALDQATPVAGTAVYAELANRGLAFGSAGHLQQVRRAGEEALAELVAAPAPDLALLYSLDGLLHMTPLVFPAPGDGGGVAPIYVPVHLDALRLYAAPACVPAWGHVQLRPGSCVQDLTLSAGNAADGAAPRVELRGLQLALLGETAYRELDQWLFTPQWELASRPQPASLHGTPHTTAAGAPEGIELAPQGRWIVFADAAGLGAAVAAQIRSAGGTAVLVTRKASPAALGPDEWSVDATAALQLGELFDQLCANPQPERAGVLYLWGLDCVPSPQSSAGDLLAAQEVALAPLFTLVQEMARRRWELAPELWIVTRGAAHLAGEDLVGAPAQAPLWGVGRVVGAEHPDFWGGLIDLSPAFSIAAAPAALCAALAAPGDDQELVLAPDGRRSLRLLPAAARDVSLESARAWRLRPDAAYLITGGLGELGLLVARWLVEQGARRLILLGRTPLPPRGEWAAADPESPTGRRIAAVRALEHAGTAVHLAAVDVSCEATVRAFLATYAAEGWPQVRGVIHAAGVVRDQLLVNAGWDEVADVLRAKIAGSWALHRLLPDLDFFVLFSSLGALLGQPGQGSYAAANAFLDALAQARRAGGQAALSINWGPWRDVGFAATAGGRLVTEQLRAEGIAELAPAEGLDVLHRLLSAPAPAEIVVLPPAVGEAQPSPRSKLLRSLLHQTGPAADMGDVGPLAAAATAAGRASDLRTVLLDLEPASRRAHLAGYLQTVVAQVLRMPAARVGHHASLGALGLDSLMALELRNRLERGLRLELPATFVWNYPTIDALLPYLAVRMGITLDMPAPASSTTLGRAQAAAPPGGAVTATPTVEQLLAGIADLTDEGALDLLKI